MHPASLDYWLSAFKIITPPLYLVGGTVRDLLLGDQPKDIDLVCRNAKDFAFRLGKSKNAAVITLEKKPEEPCYRVISRSDPDTYLDIAEMRGPTIHEDLGRRDFTINSIAAEVKGDGTVGILIDPYLGAQDLKQRLIKMTSREAFISDPLRILRAFRFSAALGFTIEPQTKDAIIPCAKLLAKVSGERIFTELLLILKSRHSVSFIREIDQSGILEVLFPEIRAMKNCAQGGYHHTDVWEHSLLVLENCESILNERTGYFGPWAENVLNNLSRENRFSLLKLAALFHDIGKPLIREKQGATEKIPFYGHDKEGAKLVEAIGERLRLSARDRDYLVLLVAEHLHVLRLSGKHIRDAARMKWFRKVQDDAIPLIILGIADVKSSLGQKSTAEWRNAYLAWSIHTVRDYYGSIKTRLESQNLCSGNDLINLGMEPGPEMGRCLVILRNAQDTGDITTREDALALAKELLKRRTVY